MIRVPRTGRLARGFVASSLWLALACADDVAPPAVDLDRTLVLLTPGTSVSAAVLELRGIEDVAVPEGDVLSRRDGDVLRTVILLDEPGELVMDVSLRGPDAVVSGVVTQVADAADRIVEALDGFELELRP